MIHEITINEDLMSVLELAINKYKFTFTGNVFYINSSENAQSIFTNLRLTNYAHRIITSKNYTSIASDMVKEWCKQILVKDEIDRLEQQPEYQERLDAINTFLDTVEKMRKGGENGKANTETATKNQ